jgi:P27 family predicted phage terminase small subunit
MPLDMSPTAKTIWRRVLREMGETGVIRAVDADVLRAYCEAVSRYSYAATTLEQAGPLITARGTGARRGELVKNPLHQIVRDDALLVRAFARELGLTPSARAGLETPAGVGGMAAELDRVLPVQARLRVMGR